MRRNPNRAPDTASSPSDDGAFQALDQMANWVRFADTKATILTAGLGVLITMLMTNSKTVYQAMKTNCNAAWAVGLLTGGAAIALGYTLLWLARAIRPTSTVNYQTLNRFAWPSLTKTDAAALATHARQHDAQPEAWQQVAELSRIADRKFTACRHAIGGFTMLVLFGILCISVATAITA